jgi:hypothetical protein
MLALNRSAIVVRPKSPFLDWLHAADPTSVTLALPDLAREATIYLIPECGDADEERAALQTVFPAIFEDRLNAGVGIERCGRRHGRSEPLPAGDCQFHSTLPDLSDEPLIEEYD